MFVLAKICNKSNDLYKGERLIKGLLKMDPINIKSLFVLFEIQKKLNKNLSHQKSYSPKRGAEFFFLSKCF